MAVIDIKMDPKPRDLKIFAALWVVFFLVLAKIAFATDNVVRNAAIFTSICFVISILLNTDFPKKLQMWGLLIPGALWTIWAGEHFASQVGTGWLAETHALGWRFVGTGAQWLVFGVIAAIGVVGSLVMLASNATAKTVYRTWMFAALPMGWVISHIILGVMFFLIITPIGLLVRLIKGDSMTRKPDPAAATYWIEHKQETNNKRYFQQF
jgi:hypothetical protein